MSTGDPLLPPSFVRDLAHDLVNPLASVLGFLDLLLSPEAKDPLTHRQRRMLSAMTRSSTHLLGLARDLAELSRAESGAPRPGGSRVDLAAAARTVFGRYQLLAGLRRIQMSVEAPPDLPAVRADPHGMDVFFDALVRAAGRRTHEGGQIILRMEKDGPDILGRMEHTGDMVIPGADEPLFSGSLAGPRPTEGYAALGLALLRRIARGHGGDADVLPRMGGGALFRFRFPAAP